MINQIKSDMKEAMKDRENGKVRLSTLRMLLTTIDNERIKLKVSELNDEQVITCINRNLKQLDQEIESLIKADRNIDPQLQQAEVLKAYLPQQLTEEEVREVVEKVIAKVNAEAGRNFGLTMKYLTTELKGKADMKLVSKLAKELS